MSIQGFVNYAKLAFVPDAAAYSGYNYEKNKKEKAGDFLLLPTTTLPRQAYEMTTKGIKWTWKQANDPQVITLSITAAALIANSFLFYPKESEAYATAAYNYSKEAVEEAVRIITPYLEKIPLRFTAYILTQTQIAGLCLRTLGRFSNKTLVNKVM